MKNIKEWAQDERPRERLVNSGASVLSNAELIAILLGKGARDASAVDLANSILAMMPEGIRYLPMVTREELCHIPGIGAAKASQVLAAVELGKRVATSPGEKRINLMEPASVAKLFMENMRYLKKEVFCVLLLDTRNGIIAQEEISVGNLNSSIVHPREVFERAVRRSASAVLLVHNHPSGNPEPSENDKDVTRRLVDAGNLLGIPVLDHLVIGDGIFVSMREQMLL